MRRQGLLIAALVVGCFVEDGTSDERGEASSGGDCSVGASGCACRPDGACEAGLLCVDARCEAPQADASSSDASTVDASAGSTSESTSDASSTSSTSDAPAESSSETTGVSRCSGSCSECHDCALAGPCNDVFIDCGGDQCAGAPLCLQQCAVEMLHGCAECCAGMLALETALMDCFEAQCGPECAFSCPD
ncbi:MAG TPA: hypothetical protein VG755_35080 [Nannocystaceae bacterium]|nr:hypothetical protein [Nannocystaceae bacterium]